MNSILIEASVLEQPNPSGVNYFTYNLSNALEIHASEQLKVHYLWLNFLGKKSPQSSLIKKATKDNRLSSIRYIPQRAYVKLLSFGIAPPLAVKKTSWSLFPNFYTWPLLPSRKTAVVVHDLCFLRHPQYVEERNRIFLSRTVKKSVAGADLVIAVSEFTKQELINLLDVPEAKITVVDIPVNTELFTDELNKGPDYLLKRFNLTKKYIFGISTLEPRKNFESLVEAYCKLPGSIRNNHSLVIAGKWGWKSEELRKLIEKRQQEGYDIVLTGHISDTDRATLYKNASVFVFPSYYEGFGMPVLEAMYCGVPVVASDISVLREVGKDACLWTKQDPVSLSENLKKILASKKLQQQMSAKGAAQARKLSWKTTAEKLVLRLNEDGE